jgi:hypothetical protein
MRTSTLVLATVSSSMIDTTDIESIGENGFFISTKDINQVRAE